MPAFLSWRRLLRRVSGIGMGVGGMTLTAESASEPEGSLSGMTMGVAVDSGGRVTAPIKGCPNGGQHPQNPECSGRKQHGRPRKLVFRPPAPRQPEGPVQRKREVDQQVELQSVSKLLGQITVLRQMF